MPYRYGMNQRRGYVSGLAAYLIWGFFPLYFHELLPATAVEILANRVIWSLVFVAVITTVHPALGHVGTLVRSSGKLGGIALAGLLRRDQLVRVHLRRQQRSRRGDLTRLLHQSA